MKKSKILLISVLILSISMLACAFGGGNKPANNAGEVPAAQNEPAAEEPLQEEPAPAEAETTIETDFPLLADAQNLMETGGTVFYQSNTSLQDAYDFYMNEFTGQGLVENELLGLKDDSMFQLVFTGSDNGKSLVIQTIQLDETTINVTLRYE